MKRSDQIFPRFLLPIAGAAFLLMSLAGSGVPIAPAMFMCSITLFLVSAVVMPMMKRLERLEARTEQGDD